MKPVDYYTAVFSTLVIMTGYVLILSTPVFRTRNIAIPMALFLSAILALIWGIVLARRSRERRVQRSRPFISPCAYRLE